MNGSTLIAARGAQRVTRSELTQFVPPPKSPTWQPVSHSELIDTLHSELDHRGLRVKDEHYAVQKQGLQLFGTLDLDWQDTGDYAAAMGIRTSNDRSLSITLVAGARVFACTNLCLSGDLIALKRKHTSRLNLAQELAGAIDRYQSSITDLYDGLELLKTRMVKEDNAKGMVYDIFKRKIVPLRMFHGVTEYIHAHQEQNPILTKWEVYNAFTEHIKTMPPAAAFRSTVTLGKFFSLS